ncbi:unnamed protein product [Phaedon cochleariae]|uniref:G-protein coupled receptors family 2 profile 2 domain-containing protein n=1 Tax=Phaedon cochleariae TaxID=80249 RepID=A0A9P0DB42_PHACE|nr:unnamed protein product [Phaedon cochleariae]
MRQISSVKGVGVLFVFQLTNLVILSNEDHVKICPDEFSTLPNSSQKVLWQAAGTDHEIILSDPPCTDELGNLMIRVCSNGTWTPKNRPSCIKTVDATRKCPGNFQESENSCIFVTEPQQWKENCESIAASTPSSILENGTVWLPFRKSSKYGPFESVKRGESFGTPLDNNLKVPMKYDTFQKNCLAFNTMTGAMEVEDCSNLHNHVCEFAKNEIYKCPRDCVNAAINSNHCYCKLKGQCEHLAEIRSIFDKNILSDLAGNDLCSVGGPQLIDGYTPAISEHTWLYTNKPIEFTLCYSELLQVRDAENVHMLLNFDEKKRRLFLVVYNPNGLFDDADEDSIYCFTDAAPFDLRKRMYVKQINEQNSTKSSYKVYEVDMVQHIGQYWCQAYGKFDADEVHSNQVIGYTKKPGNEYALRIIIDRVCMIFNCTDEPLSSYQNSIHANLSSTFNTEVRLMEIFTFDYHILDVLIHISTPHKKPVYQEYYTLRKKLQSSLKEIEIVYFKSSEFCLPELSYSETGRQMSWPLTPIGQNAISEPFCLQDNGLPLFRLCEGNFMFGADWSNIVGDCDDGLELPESVKDLQSMTNETITNSTFHRVTSIINHEPDLPVLSIYYIAKMLETIFLRHENATSGGSIPDEAGGTLNITDSLMNVDRKSLAKAQDFLNITDGILDSINEILSTAKVDPNVVVIQRENVALHSTNPFLSNVSGVIVYSNNEKGITIKSLRRNETFDAVEYDKNLLLAYYVPEEILGHFKDDNLTIITTVFFNDRLFVSNYTKKPAGIVLSITIPGHGIYLPSTIPILFRSIEGDDIPECGFWDYGKKLARKKGRWSTIGGDYMGHFENKSSFHLCSYSHLTHFALLILESERAIKENNDNVLSIITYIGDFFSVCGIFGIFLTAIVYKKWRQKPGTIILLNLSVALVLEIILMQIIEMSPIIVSTGCEIFGKIIHYVVVSKFSWMLIYSFLQYMRFVKVFTILPDNIAWLSVIFGWGFGIIPVVIVVAVDPYSYTMEKYNFCYPAGLSLYLGFFMPIFIIIFINTFVFFAIMRQVTSKTVESHGNKDNIHKLQIQLAALLFFILGVPWLFVIFSKAIPITWIQTCLIYLFCITTNIQGFILFIFYVVFNGETRNFWLKYFTKREIVHISVSTKTSSRF